MAMSRARLDLLSPGCSIMAVAVFQNCCMFFLPNKVSAGLIFDFVALFNPFSLAIQDSQLLTTHKMLQPMALETVTQDWQHNLVLPLPQILALRRHSYGVLEIWGYNQKGDVFADSTSQRQTEH